MRFGTAVKTIPSVEASLKLKPLGSFEASGSLLENQGTYRIMSYYVHHVPGRLRVRIPEVRKTPRLAGKIREILDIPGIFELSINDVTGSTVVLFSESALTCAGP